MPRCCDLTFPHVHTKIARLTAALHMNDPDVPEPVKVVVAKARVRGGERTGNLVVVYTDHPVYDLDDADVDDLLTAPDADAVLRKIEEVEREQNEPDDRDTYNAAFFGVRRERR